VSRIWIRIKKVVVGATRRACLFSVLVALGAGVCCGGRPAAVSLSAASGPPTSEVLVSGSGYEPYSEVDIYFDTRNEAKAIADGAGSFSQFAIRAPVSALPGEHWVSAVQGSGDIGAQAPFVVNTDWSQFGFEPDGRRVNPYENVLSPETVGGLNLKWSYPSTGGTNSSPAVVDGVAYFGSQDNHVYAIKLDSGTLLWSYDTGYFNGASSPAVVDGVVYIGSQNGMVYALDAAKGSRLWSYTTGDSVWSSPAVVNGVVYVASEDGNLYALDAARGKKLWSYSTGGYIYSSPAVANGVVYVGSSDHKIYALKANTGGLLWSYTTGDQVGSSPAVANGVVYVGSLDYNVYALNASSGGVLWIYRTGGEVYSSPAVANGVVYIGSRDNNVYALEAETGARLWSYTTGWFVDSSPAVANGVVYVGSEDDNLYALNAGSGALLWNYNTGANIFYASPTVANGVVYSGSDLYNGTAFYAFELGGGDSEKRQAGFDRPDLQTLRADSNIRASEPLAQRATHLH
jgi:outer membrane protein assembly factor BamB